MAKTTRSRARMDRYFKHLHRNSYILSYNKKGSYLTQNKKWDLIKRLTKKLHLEAELSGIKAPEKVRCSDSAVNFLPRQDVMLCGMIPAREQRLYSTCKNCSRVFNPPDTLSHRNCRKSHAPHSGLLKENVKSENGNSKSLSSNGSPSSHSWINASPVLPSPSTLPKEPVKEFEFKRPYTPPPKKVRQPIRQSKTFLSTTKTSKSGSVTKSGNTPPLTTSSDKSDSKMASKMSSSQHNPTRSSPRHHSSKSSPSRNSDYVLRSGKLAVTVVATSVKSTPMDTLPPSSPSHHCHHHRSTRSSSRLRKSSSDASKRSSTNSSGSSTGSMSSSCSSSSSSKSLQKDYDAELHGGSIEQSRSPGVRSVTSNHRFQLRKQVSGRSKDSHQMSSEKKAAKANDMKHTTPTFSYSSPNGEAKDMLSANTAYVPIAGQLVSTNNTKTNSFVHLVPKFSNHLSRHSTTSVLSKKLGSGKDEKESAKVVANGYITQAKKLENTQDNPVGTDSVLIMPASPVSVVSSVQTFVDIKKNVKSQQAKIKAHSRGRGGGLPLPPPKYEEADGRETEEKILDMKTPVALNGNVEVPEPEIIFGDHLEDSDPEPGNEKSSQNSLPGPSTEIISDLSDPPKKNRGSLKRMTKSERLSQSLKNNKDFIKLTQNGISATERYRKEKLDILRTQTQNQKKFHSEMLEIFKHIANSFIIIAENLDRRE